MKVSRLILAVLAALWTMGVAAGVIAEIGKHGGTRGIVESVAGIAVTAAMVALTIWLFQGAFPKSPPAPVNNQSQKPPSGSNPAA